MKPEKIFLSTIDEHAPSLAKAHGFGLEFAEFCTAWNLDDHFQETDTAIREKMRNADHYTLHGPFNELFPCAIDPKARQLTAKRFQQAIATAQRYGINKVILHGGYNPWLYFPCWYTEQSTMFWQEFLKDIPDGMTVCVENVLEEEPQMLAQIIRSVDNPKIRMCLDVGHAHAYSKSDVMDWVTQCADIIDHFHIHNNDSSWDTHSALNDGTIPMGELLHSIEHLCPNATITLELPDATPSIQWLHINGFLEVYT